MKILLTILFCLLLSPAALATTYYVRADGGTLSQCTGLANTPYPGTGTAQNCAWHHPFDALPPQGDGANPAVALHGGDTLIIGAGSFRDGCERTGCGNTYPACNQNWSWDCFMASVPSGTSGQPTRILGAGWDQGCSAPPQLWRSEQSEQVISLNGSSNVTQGCLELTDHISCIESHLGRTSPYACNRSTPPFGPWASRGIYAKDAANVTLQDLNIHGMANRGILAGRLTNWTVSRVKIIANGWGGWDGDLAEPAGSSNSGQMLFQSVEVGFNGCGETWPDKQIVGCWGQQEGGYGDGLGTTTTGGNWIFENSYFHHNTQDGLDLLYANTTATITVKQSHAEGNAGNQIKLAGSPTVQDSVIVGNCSYFQGKYNMSGDNSAGANTAGDLCRAMGNALVLSVQPTLKALVQYNTIAGEGDCLDTSRDQWRCFVERRDPEQCADRQARLDQSQYKSAAAVMPVLLGQRARDLASELRRQPGLADKGQHVSGGHGQSLRRRSATDRCQPVQFQRAAARHESADRRGVHFGCHAFRHADFLGLPRPEALNGYDIGAVEFQPGGSGGGPIPNQPPIAVASATITAGVAPLAVSFNGSGSSDPDGSIASYTWTFGDVFDGIRRGRVTHIYAAVGIYSAKLTVTDNSGAAASQSLTITVSASPPIIAPSGLSASAGKRGTVTLHWTDNTSGAQGIYVERAPASGGAYTRVGQTLPTSTTYSQAGVDAGSYLYRVQAYSAASASAYSNDVNVRIK